MKKSRSTSSRRGAASPSRALSVAARGTEIQPFGVLAPRAIALPARTCATSVANLNKVLADTMFLRDLYKKHHWQTTGPTFQQLHELFDAHYEQQSELVDVIAERITTLGGVGIAMPQDVAELANIPCPPRGREPVAVQLRRLLEGHELVIALAREFAETADEDGDAGTNDMLVGQVIRTNEKQAWFLAENAA